MAKSGTIKGNKIGHYGVEIDWSASQSVADNSSTITAKVYITYYSIDIKARSSGKCTIDGTTYTYSTAAINHNAGAAYRRLVLPIPGIIDASSLRLPIFLIWAICERKSLKSN